MKRIIIVMVAVVLGAMGLSVPVSATTGPETFAVETAILKDCGAKADGSDGEGVFCVLNTVVDIMTIGIGILGVLGITIVGIQYLTAGGSEEKTRKAKRRLFEIVIGLVAYVVIYALLKWLLPGFA